MQIAIEHLACTKEMQVMKKCPNLKGGILDQ